MKNGENHGGKKIISSSFPGEINYVLDGGDTFFVQPKSIKNGMEEKIKTYKDNSISSHKQHLHFPFRDLHLQLDPKKKRKE